MSPAKGRHLKLYPEKAEYVISCGCSEKLKLAKEAPDLPLQTPGGIETSSEELLYCMFLSLNCRFTGVN